MIEVSKTIASTLTKVNDHAVIFAFILVEVFELGKTLTLQLRQGWEQPVLISFMNEQDLLLVGLSLLRMEFPLVACTYCSSRLLV